MTRSVVVRSGAAGASSLTTPTSLCRAVLRADGSVGLYLFRVIDRPDRRGQAERSAPHDRGRLGTAVKGWAGLAWAGRAGVGGPGWRGRRWRGRAGQARWPG